MVAIKISRGFGQLLIPPKYCVWCTVCGVWCTVCGVLCVVYCVGWICQSCDTIPCADLKHVLFETEQNNNMLKAIMHISVKNTKSLTAFFVLQPFPIPISDFPSTTCERNGEHA